MARTKAFLNRPTILVDRNCAAVVSVLREYRRRTSTAFRIAQDTADSDEWPIAVYDALPGDRRDDRIYVRSSLFSAGTGPVAVQDADILNFGDVRLRIPDILNDRVAAKYAYVLSFQLSCRPHQLLSRLRAPEPAGFTWFPLAESETPADVDRLRAHATASLTRHAYALYAGRFRQDAIPFREFQALADIALRHFPMHYAELRARLPSLCPELSLPYNGDRLRPVTPMHQAADVLKRFYPDLFGNQHRLVVAATFASRADWSFLSLS